MGERKLCYGCMERTEFTDGVCPRCGYYENSPSDPSFIIPGTQLHNRYIVGVVLSVNGEGITYLAYDQSTDCKVKLREYMPHNLCSRVADSPTVRVIPLRLAQYKALMAEFTELYKSLAKLRGQVHICTVVDLFAENNTTYVVDEYIESVRLIDYLKDNAGELTWNQFSQMLPLLMTTLSLLHNSGVIHRAISPNTIYVTEKDELVLTAFSTAAARTENTELECELYNGYAAPEQYAANTRQGTWTDIYAVCAVLYRVLTGSMPPSAISRMENDNLVAPYVMNPNVPKHISNIIMQGMHLNGDARIQSVTKLVTDLFDENVMDYDIPYNGYNISQDSSNSGYAENNYETYDNQEYPDYDTGYSEDYSYDDYDSDTNSKYNQEKAGAIDRLKVPIIVGIVLLLIMLIAVFVFASSMFDDDGSTSSTAAVSTTTTMTSETQEATTEAETGDSIMPNLVGKNYENQKVQYSSWITFDVEEVYNDNYNAGIICWQEYEAGESFDSSKSVKIQVSKGPATIEIPSYSNTLYSTYCAELDELGVPYTVSYVATSSYTNNVVVKVTKTKNDVDEIELAAGDTIDMNDGYSLIVYYAYNPPATTAVTTAATMEETEVVETEATTTAAAEESVAETAAPAEEEAEN